LDAKTPKRASPREPLYRIFYRIILIFYLFGSVFGLDLSSLIDQSSNECERLGLGYCLSAPKACLEGQSFFLALVASNQGV
jgi:hypothetical protein